MMFKRKIQIRSRSSQEDLDFRHNLSRRFRIYGTPKRKYRYNPYGVSPAAVFIRKTKKSSIRLVIMVLFSIFALFAVVPLLVIYLATNYYRIIKMFLENKGL